MLRFALIFLFAFSFQLSAQVVSSDFVYKIRMPIKKTDSLSPVLFIFHGYGSNEDDLFGLAQTMDERLTVISLRAPIALGNTSFCWFKIDRSNGSLLYNYEEVTQTRLAVRQFIQNTCKSKHLDSTRVYLMGFSQGTMMSYDLALSYPGKYAGVLALSGRLMKESKTQSKSAALKNTTFFIAHGTEDLVIPMQESEMAFTYLKERGLTKIEYKTYRMQHVLNGQEIIDIRAWLSKNVEKAPQGLKSNPTNHSKIK